MITGAARRAAAACELWCLSATELAAAIRSRQVSSREVIQAHLRRIEAVNPLINAVTVVLGEQALQAAKAADRAAARGEQLPPFHGVPFTVKENIDLADTATTQGAQALAGAYPSRDAPVVERLKAAGAIPVGRTNLPTYGVGWVCESELYGATVNPWDRSRTPGASSGGEAAALAAGMTPLGLTVIIRNADGFDLALHPVWQVEPSPAFLHAGFRAAQPADVRALTKRMEADGITIVERNDEAAYVAFKCLDPDGHRIEVYILGATARPMMRNLQPGLSEDAPNRPGSSTFLNTGPESRLYPSAAICSPTRAAAPSAVSARYPALCG